MWSFAWGVTHHQYCILTTCLAVTTPSYCAVENRSKSEGSCTVYKNKAYLVVIFPLEPEARSIDDKTTELVTQLNLIQVCVLCNPECLGQTS